MKIAARNQLAIAAKDERRLKEETMITIITSKTIKTFIPTRKLGLRTQ